MHTTHVLLASAPLISLPCPPTPCPPIPLPPYPPVPLSPCPPCPPAPPPPCHPAALPLCPPASMAAHVGSPPVLAFCGNSSSSGGGKFDSSSSSGGVGGGGTAVAGRNAGDGGVGQGQAQAQGQQRPGAAAESLFEAVELLLFESIATAKLGADSSMGGMSGGAAAAVLAPSARSRLLSAAVGAIAKLAAAETDLRTRARVCLSKVVRSRTHLHPSVSSASGSAVERTVEAHRAVALPLYLLSSQSGPPDGITHGQDDPVYQGLYHSTLPLPIPSIPQYIIAMAYGCPFAAASSSNAGGMSRSAARCPIFLLVGAAICAAFTGLQEVVPAAWLQQLLVLRFFSSARVGDRPWRDVVALTVAAVATQACGMTVAYAGMYAVGPTAHTLASMLLVARNVLPMTAVLLLPCLADSLFRFTYRLSQNLHPLVFPLVSTSIWTLLTLLSPFGATAHPNYSLRSVLPLVQATAWVGMHGVLLVVAWLVGGIHQVMWEQDAVGRGEEGWRRSGGGRVVGEESEEGYSQLCGEGCSGGNAVRDAGGEREGGGSEGVRGGRDEGRGGEGAGGESRGRGGGSGWSHVQVSAALLVVLMAAGSARETVLSSSFFQKPLADTMVPSVPVSCILSQAATNNIPPQPPSSLSQSAQHAASAEAAGARQLMQGEEGGVGGKLRGVGEGDAEGEVSSAAGAIEGREAAAETAESTPAAAATAAGETWEEWEAWRVAGIARMVQQTQQRARAGDTLILWSEAAVILLHAHEETTLLADLAAIATAASTNRTAVAAGPAAGADPAALAPFIGASYMKLISPTQFTNSFTLIAPSGTPILRYNKTHPVPSVEGNVLPGDGTLPVVDTPLGRLSVAICFDLQFPALISQAGRQGVDILLQPSWTWGAIGHVTFETDAVRAAENGLTLLRCSSIGVSGVVSPYYRTLAAQEGLDTGLLTMVLPLLPHAQALYPYAGLPMSLLLLSLTLLAAFLAIAPPSLSLPLCRCLPNSLCSLLPHHLCLARQWEERGEKKRQG
ncbi:unnamed protein product [Closterium sp. NIES-65]|nr:unnamed protein product [Closterium sp. NIES-65]